MNLDHLRGSSRDFIGRDQLALAILTTEGSVRFARTIVFYRRSTLGTVEGLRHYWSHYTRN